MSKTDECRCWLCGGTDHLDEHHIFGGVADRKKCDKLGLTVYLCHDSCHIFGRDAVHQNHETMLRLRRWGQRKAMAELGWSVEQFRAVFGKNYLTDEDECMERSEASESDFVLL